MAFKPGRRQEGDVDFDKLRAILNQTKQSTQNNPFYQFCNSLLNSLTTNFATVNTRIESAGSGGGGGVIPPTPTPDAVLDYVVMSDGATPIPSPMNDGFGNFIYIPYEP